MSGMRVYVGGLPDDIRRRDVERFFESYGRLNEIILKNGFCFVEFSNHKDADDAVHDLNGKKLLGRRVVVETARGRDRERDYYSRENYRDRDPYPRRNKRFSPARRTHYRVTVENLSSRIQWQDLKDFLTRVGKVTYAKAHNLRRNEGMVEFDSHDDMVRVIEELNGAELNGRRIRIREASRSSRSRSPLGRSRSRSRSRSPIPRKSKSRSRSHNFREESKEPDDEKPPREKNSRSRSVELSRKRSTDSEDRSNNKRSKRSSSRSQSPSN